MSWKNKDKGLQIKGVDFGDEAALAAKLTAAISASPFPVYPNFPKPLEISENKNSLAEIDQHLDDVAIASGYYLVDNSKKISIQRFSDTYITAVGRKSVWEETPLLDPAPSIFPDELLPRHVRESKDRLSTSEYINRRVLRLSQHLELRTEGEEGNTKPAKRARVDAEEEEEEAEFDPAGKKDEESEDDDDMGGGDYTEKYSDDDEDGADAFGNDAGATM